MAISLGGVTWRRRPMETAEQFEERIIADLKELSAHDNEPAPMANEVVNAR